MISAKTLLIMSRDHVSRYNTHNEEDDIFPWCKFELFRNSFISDVVKQSKFLIVQVREVISINPFRKILGNLPSFSWFFFVFWLSVYQYDSYRAET